MIWSKTDFEYCLKTKYNHGFYKFVGTNKKGRYLNVPCAFDIETTSTYVGEEKTAYMYAWSFAIDDNVFIGRTWSEFFELLECVQRHFAIDDKHRLIIYVHNLSFEFQFIRKMFRWQKVFALAIREPIFARDENGIEFRCSYLLSGYNLATLAKNLRSHNIKKLVGDLDYKKVRHSGTPLTDDELAYCANDVLIVTAYIMECIEESGDISKIPYTKTGYVRNYCRNECFYENDKPRKESAKFWPYKKLMKSLTLEPAEYLELKRGFQGGFTHANPFCSGKVIEDVTSYDFTSSYPAVMVAERFPMGRGERLEIKSLDHLRANLRLYACLFTIKMTNVRPKITFDHYISRSRCILCDNPIVDNGRVVSADVIIMTITDVDFAILEKCYKWDSISVSDFIRYRRGYLPTDFVKAILKLYKDKTELKGVKGKESEYMVAKGMLNSCYGMCVTDIVRDEITHADDWEIKHPILEKEIEKYNNSFSRFLSYPWGVWVTAYARKNLWSGILEFKDDYIYSDTDSIKCVNVSAHKKYLEIYNEGISRKLMLACEHHGIDYRMTRPKTIKGLEKPLGVWDFDGHYKRFKTLGAKRYVTEKDDGEIEITVAGLNKVVPIDFIKSLGSDFFESFTDDLYIPPEFTGKLCHTYIDDEQGGEIVDYLGNKGFYHEFSSVHLSETDFTLKMSDDYTWYLFKIVEDLKNEKK